MCLPVAGEVVLRAACPALAQLSRTSSVVPHNAQLSRTMRCCPAECAVVPHKRSRPAQ